MTTTQAADGGSSSGSKPAKETKTDAAKTGDKAAAAASTSNAQPTGDAPKKLTGAQLKALKQAEKAKRRAAVVAAKEAAGGGAGGAASTTPASGGAGGPPGGSHHKSAPSIGGGGKGGKGKQDGQGPGGAQGVAAGGGAGAAGAGAGPGSLARRPSVSAAAVAAEREKEARSAIPETFSHLSMAKRISVAQANRDVHPAVHAVGQQMGSFALRGNVARLEATLLAFKKVIQSYRTPPGNAFSRHFVSHVLNPQIEYLTECRPMCFAMGNAIRLLKARVAQLDLDLDDKDAIAELCESIDGFIQERVFVAAIIITREAANMICDGDTVLTYGGPRLVRSALEHAWDNGVRFDLTIVDDPNDPAAGQALAKEFHRRTQQSGELRDDRTVIYSPSLDGLDYHLSRTSKVFVGVESVFANGAILAPAGTCDVAMAASAQGRPFIALCETVNFDRDRVATDALAYNEIDPEHADSESFRLLFDTTQAKYVSMLITEYEEASGLHPAHAIYSVLRTKEDPN